MKRGSNGKFRLIFCMLIFSVILLTGCNNNLNDNESNNNVDGTHQKEDNQNTNNSNIGDSNYSKEDVVQVVDQIDTNILTKKIDKNLVGVYKDYSTDEYFEISENGMVTLKIEPGDGAPIVYNNEDIDVYFCYVKNSPFGLEAWDNVIIRFDVNNNNTKYSYVYYGGYIFNNTTSKTTLSFTDGRNTPVGTGESYRFEKVA